MLIIACAQNLSNVSPIMNLNSFEDSVLEYLKAHISFVLGVIGYTQWILGLVTTIDIYTKIHNIY